MVLDLGLAVLNFTNWGELRQRGSVGFLDQEASISRVPKIRGNRGDKEGGRFPPALSYSNTTATN